MCNNEENVSYYSSIYSLKNICTRNRTSLAQKLESMDSYGWAYAQGVRAAYTWNNRSVKEKVLLHAEGPIRDWAYRRRNTVTLYFACVSFNLPNYENESGSKSENVVNLCFAVLTIIH